MAPQQPVGGHLFVSAGGKLLPRWQEAFPDARGVDIGQRVRKRPPLVWLRLTSVAPLPEQVESARRAAPGVPLVVFSDEPNDEQALAVFAAGVRGYCNSHAESDVLRQIAAVVAQGGLWIGESLMSRLLGAMSHLPAPAEQRADWAEKLTEREREVARAVARGASNKEIARDLGITERTIKAHVGAIFEKLGVRDRLRLSLLVNGQRPG